MTRKEYEKLKQARYYEDPLLWKEFDSRYYMLITFIDGVVSKQNDLETFRRQLTVIRDRLVDMKSERDFCAKISRKSNDLVQELIDSYFNRKILGLKKRRNSK